MSDPRQIYLKEDEVEHVISALAGSTSARDLAEAIGRSEDEVIHVLQELRKDQQPLSEADMLREQNAHLQRQIDELKSKTNSLDLRRRIRIVAACVAFLALMAGMFMFVSARRTAGAATGQAAEGQATRAAVAPISEQPARATDTLGTPVAPVPAGQ